MKLGITLSSAKIAVAGIAGEVRDQQKRWEGLTEQVLLSSPSAGMSAQRTFENLTAIAELSS